MPLHLRHLSRRLHDVMTTLLPSSCALCGAIAQEALCAGCRTQFFGNAVVRCNCCGITLGSGEARCGDCLRQQPAYDATIIACDYAPPLDQLVLALKFGNRLELAGLLAAMLRDAALRMRDMPLPQVLTAVPLGSRRLVERGFNQALEIAKPLSHALGVPLDRALLIRRRDTLPQSLLHPDARQRNLRQAFVVPPDAMESVHGRHIGIVDDVMTTGETLNQAAATLKRFGATRVTNFVFARTPPA